jgi:hypothetical protein
VGLSYNCLSLTNGFLNKKSKNNNNKVEAKPFVLAGKKCICNAADDGRLLRINADLGKIILKMILDQIKIIFSKTIFDQIKIIFFQRNDLDLRSRS